MHQHALSRRGALLAINLLFVMVWGFAGLDKLFNGPPAWFQGKFGPTFLAKIPGLTATFWLLALSELVVFALAVIALARGEFLERRPTIVLGWTLAGSLFVFVQLGFGQWLTGDFASGAQLFNYFAGTLLSLHFVLMHRAAA
jgi:hypothetical protein